MYCVDVVGRASCNHRVVYIRGLFLTHSGWNSYWNSVHTRNLHNAVVQRKKGWNIAQACRLADVDLGLL